MLQEIENLFGKAEKKLELEKILYDVFGYNQFRPPQKEIIESILDDHDVLAILPTGAGKSVCYQLPSLIFDGLTIVISPLISLMQDQVEQIKSKIPSAYLNSFQSYEEQRKINALIIDKKIKLLYVSPEKFNTTTFQQLISKVKVSHLAVDEAHCISHWGHDFRPSYLKIAEIFNEIPRCPVSAFTATATPEVRFDIIKLLELQTPKIFVKGFYRPNIQLEVIRSKNRIDKLIDVLSNTKGSKIIYCQTRKETEELNDKLVSKNFPSLPYHAGMTNEERTYTQEFFLNNKSEIIVATNAFGMGINKPDIRSVIHFGMPDSIESFYQEFGRAGRDGLKSFSFLIHSNRDRKIHEFFLHNSFPSRKTIHEFYSRLNDILKLKIGETSKKVFPYDIKILREIVGKNFPDQLIQSIIKTFEQNGIIRFISENDFVLIKILFQPEKLRDLEEQIPTNSYLLLEFLFRKFGSKIFREKIKINLSTFFEEIYLLRTQIETTLNELDQAGLIDYKMQSFEDGFYFAQPRMHPEKLPINFEDIEEHLRKGIIKLNEMEKYSLTDECRWKFILKYFGEEVEEDFKCYLCDNCRTNIKMTEFSQYDIEREILKTIKEVNGQYGTNVITDILRGARSKKIMENKLFNVSTYGYLSGFSKEKIREKINKLIAYDKIHKSPSLYPVLSLTKKGEAELSGLNITEFKPEISRTELKPAIDLRKNLNLFDRLRERRKSLARKFNQPENFICPDEILREISLQVPKTREELNLIKGMTSRIVLKCGDDFLEEISNFLAESKKENEKEKFIPKNILITLNMIREGHSLIEISEKRNLLEATIAEHIITLLENSIDIDIHKLIPPSHISLIENVVKENSNISLLNLKSKLPEEISYSEIRIFLTWYQKRRLNQN